MRTPLFPDRYFSLKWRSFRIRHLPWIKFWLTSLILLSGLLLLAVSVLY
jgi:hypothetical protein